MPLVKCLMLFILIIFPSFYVHAKTVVLIHGYMSNGMSWRHSGFTKPLIAAGWKDGGGYSYSPQSMLLPRTLNQGGNVLFSVELPSQASLRIQESLLSRYLAHLYSQRKEPITLIGHSAGGVIGRFYVLNPSHRPINGLITIASPHLGTPAANIAYLAGKSPFGMVASMMGGKKLQYSRSLFSDLKEEEPNNFLFLMNRQPHPNIHYASIIRINNTITKPASFDFIVPPYSQNMNNIWALKGRSGIAKTTENHFLSDKDGLITLDILKHIK